MYVVAENTYLVNGDDAACNTGVVCRDPLVGFQCKGCGTKYLPTGVIQYLQPFDKIFLLRSQTLLDDFIRALVKAVLLFLHKTNRSVSCSIRLSFSPIRTAN